MPSTDPRRISKTYRFNPATIDVINYATKNPPFPTATSFVEVAIHELAQRISEKKQ